MIGRQLHGIGRQLRGDGNRVRGQERAVAISPAHVQEIAVADVVIVIDLALVAALLERFQQRGGLAGRADHDRIRLRGEYLEDLPGHARIGAVEALVGDHFHLVQLRELCDFGV